MTDISLLNSLARESDVTAVGRKRWVGLHSGKFCNRSKVHGCGTRVSEGRGPDDNAGQ